MSRKKYQKGPDNMIKYLNKKASRKLYY